MSSAAARLTYLYFLQLITRWWTTVKPLQRYFSSPSQGLVGAWVAPKEVFSSKRETMRNPGKEFKEFPSGNRAVRPLISPSFNLKYVDVLFSVILLPSQLLGNKSRKIVWKSEQIVFLIRCGLTQEKKCTEVCLWDISSGCWFGPSNEDKFKKFSKLEGPMFSTWIEFHPTLVPPMVQRYLRNYIQRKVPPVCTLSVLPILWTQLRSASNGHRNNPSAKYGMNPKLNSLTELLCDL